MAQVMAVAVLLNGVQIHLPAPAVMAGGRCWVPLRPIAQRLGYAVRVGDEGQPIVSKNGEVIPVPECRKRDGRTYVPARWLTRLGVRVTYVPSERQLRLAAVLPARQATDPHTPASEKLPLLARILTDPAGWADRRVTVVGEYLGWKANPLCEATSFGPPVSRSDWVLRGEGGSIYCTGALPFSPTEQLGRRAKVEATVKLTKDGWPYLHVLAVTPLRGIEGLCCYLSTDGFIYKAGATIQMKLLVRNDDSVPVRLPFRSAKQYDFWLIDDGGKEVWRWSRGKMFAQVLMERTLAPGEQYLIEEKLDLRQVRGLRNGKYFVCAELPRITRAYKHAIMIRAQQ